MRRTTTTTIWRRITSSVAQRRVRMSARHKIRNGKLGGSCLLHAEDIHMDIYRYMLFAFEFHIFTLCSNVCIIRRSVDGVGFLCTGDDGRRPRPRYDDATRRDGAAKVKTRHGEFSLHSEHTLYIIFSVSLSCCSNINSNAPIFTGIGVHEQFGRELHMWSIVKAVARSW